MLCFWHLLGEYPITEGTYSPLHFSLKGEKMKQIINCTPHTIYVSNELGEITQSFDPSGVLPRLTTSQEVVDEVEGIRITRTKYGAVEGLPAPVEGVYLLCSSLVAGAVRRPDVISPDTGKTAVRKDGQVVAVRGFQTF